MMFSAAYLSLLVLCGSVALANSFVLPRVQQCSPNCRSSLYARCTDEEGVETSIGNRRDFAGAFIGTIFAGTLASECNARPAVAAEQGQGATIWMSGKPPKVPGQKPKDKNDLSGTRKDPNFLRSISSCKSQCENSVGPDGYARSKEECLSDCQDICCSTYEQCTFAIVPRM